MRKLRLSSCGMALLWAGTVCGGPIEYNRDIRPILSDTCFKCHGPDSAARKGDLRLDQREAAIESGSIVPGKPEESESIRRLFSEDPEELMPPPASHKVLTPEQKELLKRWVAEGAVYQPHWSFIAPTKPALPQVSNPAWVSQPIDAFILAKLDQAGLAPAPEADRRTLARRLSLDLIGLPPTPEEVEAFARDESPSAYEAYVDRLLATEKWGEHRGRYWLDVARYADTHGIHFDNFREMWSYRDWVINAFNKNMPFDQFTVEQLAGDLIPNRSLEQVVASGFNRCNMTTNEGGVIPEEYLVLYTRDRTETTAQAWMGLTAGCAVCHDHKYDPITMKEFYSMAAFFNNTTQGAMDGNIPNTPPIVNVPRPEDRAAYDALVVQVNEAKQALDARVAAARSDFDKWQLETKPEAIGGGVPTEELALHAPMSGGEEKVIPVSLLGQPREIALANPIAWEAGYAAPKAVKVQQENVMAIPEAGDFDFDKPFSASVWVKLPADGMTGAILARMDEGNDFRGWDLWIQGNRFGTHIVHKWPDDAFKLVAKETLQKDVWYHLALTYDGSKRFLGVKLYVNGVEQKYDVEAKRLKGTIKTTVPFKIGQRNNSSPLAGLLVQELRLYGKRLEIEEVTRLAKMPRVAYLVAKPAAERSAEESDELYQWWLATVDAAHMELAKKHREAEATKKEIEEKGTIAHVMNEKAEMPVAFVLKRGEYTMRGDQVGPTTPAVLPPIPEDYPKNRLGFAQWLMRPEHPLVARVTVNRFWQEIFGTGIVKTAGDFGIMGELPSHPELLDWMAIEFRDNGWDVKRFYKMLVMSSTYRQAAVVTPEKKEKDLENRLLSRGPRYRMDAEMVRDYALYASGLLSPTIGGPSVRPYQPEGVWEAVAMIGSNTRDYKVDAGESLYRRSMYTFWKRAAPPASMEIFNAPNREVCAVRRERTNTPLQALVTLNDPQFVESARHLAEMAMKEASASADERIDYIVKRLLGRSLSAAELVVVKQSLADLSAHYAADVEGAQKLVVVGESKPDPATNVSELATWTMLTNELLNLDEVLCK